MSHYSHKSMPDAKFESGSFSFFGDMESQNFPLKKGMSDRIPQEILGLTFTKMSFYIRNRSSLPKIDPPPPPYQFQQF